MPGKSSPVGLTTVSYIISLLVHSAAFGLLLWAGKGMLVPSKRSPGNLLQNNSAASAAESMREPVKELLTIESDLERTRAAREAQYQRWADHEKQQAPDDIKARLKAAEAQLQTAQTLAQRAAQEHTALKATAEALAARPVQTALTPQAAELTQKAVQVEQDAVQAREAANSAVTAQQEAIKTMDFAGNLDGALRPALQNSVHLGEQATSAQGAAADSEHAASEALKNWRDAEKALKLAEETQRKTEEAARKAEAAAQRAEAKKAREAARMAQAAAKAAAIAARRAGANGKPPIVPANPVEAANQKPASPVKQPGAPAHSPVPAPPADTPEVAAKRNDARQKLAAAVQALNAASQAHTQAAGAQASAAQAAQMARAVAESHLPHHAAGAESAGVHGTVPGPEGHGGNPADVKGRSASELYAMAVQSEQRSAEAFRHIRGVETAMSDRVPLENALANLASDTPVRPSLKPGGSLTDLFASQSDTEHDAEKAQTEVHAMLEAGRRIQERVQHGLAVSGEDRPGSPHAGASVSLSALNQAVSARAQSNLLAQEEDSHPAKDLTGWMKSMDGTEPQPGAKTPGSKTVGSKTPGAKQGIPGGTGTNAVKLSPQPGPDVVNPTEIPEIPPAQTFHALPGRRMAAAGIPSDWMFVDSWYMVGPFPNPQRANINRSFPPETDIDLDAAYTGKDNRTVKWQFLQTGGPMVVPPAAEEYAIYYGTTELWFDTPRDLWIALGSDDKSHVWINGQLVWVSSDVLKGWRLNEGWRKVHFKQGRNRVLFRLENGWRGTGFSLLIHTR